MTARPGQDARPVLHADIPLLLMSPVALNIRDAPFPAGTNLTETIVA